MKREEPTHLQCHPMAHETFRALIGLKEERGGSSTEFAKNILILS